MKYKFIALTILTFFVNTSLNAQSNKIEIKVKKDYIIKVYVNYRLVKKYPKNLIDNRKFTIVKRNGYRLEIKNLEKRKILQVHYLDEHKAFIDELIIEERENNSL